MDFNIRYKHINIVVKYFPASRKLRYFTSFFIRKGEIYIHQGNKNSYP